MTKTLAMLVATTALTAALGLPGLGAARDLTDTTIRPAAAVFDGGQGALPLVLASGDETDGKGDDDDEGNGDDDDDDEGNDDDDCDDNAACGTGSNPAPAGALPPPKNGLFGSGAAPKAQVN